MLRTPRLCGRANCQQAAVANGRCAAHAKRAPTHAKYGTREGDRIYRTAAWQRLRVAYLSNAPICQAPGCRAVATEVDHIQPHKGDRAIAFDWDNLQALCKPCHSRKTVQHDQGFGRRTKRPQGSDEGEA